MTLRYFTNARLVRAVAPPRYALCALLWLFLSACSGVYSGTVIFDGDHVFDSTVRLRGDVFMRSGSAEFASGSMVDGTVYVLGGAVAVNGSVGGDITLLDGQVTLGPTATVTGDIRHGGGQLERASGATIGGTVIRGGGVTLPLAENSGSRSAADILRTASAALILAAIGFLIVRWRLEPVETVANATLTHWPVATSWGVLALLVLPPLLVVMAFTVVLIPLVLLLGGLLFLIIGYGTIALGWRLGRWLWRLSGRPPAPATATFAGTLVLASLYNVPWVGGGLLLIVAIPTLGAIWLTRAGGRPYVSQRPSAPADLALYRRPK